MAKPKNKKNEEFFEKGSEKLFEKNYEKSFESKNNVIEESSELVVNTFEDNRYDSRYEHTYVDEPIMENFIESEKPVTVSKKREGKVISKDAVSIMVVDDDGNGVLLKGHYDVKIGDKITF